jgi:hypothetical protein
MFSRVFQPDTVMEHARTDKRRKSSDFSRLDCPSAYARERPSPLCRVSRGGKAEYRGVAVAGTRSAVDQPRWLKSNPEPVETALRNSYPTCHEASEVDRYARGM